MGKPTVCGVQIATWGTHVGGGNGMVDYMDKKWFGGNVGHAAVQITFPANDETKEWIKKYCLDPAIPFEKHKITTQKAVQDASGKFNTSDETLVEEEVYVVNFSWFPNQEGSGFALSSSVNADGYAERRGVHAEWDPRFRDFITPEQKRHKGQMGSQLMTYGAQVIEQERNLNVEQRRLLNLNAESVILHNERNTFNVLEAKMEERIDKNKAINARERALTHKDEILQKHQSHLEAVKKLGNDLKANTFKLENYNNEEQAYFKKLLGNKWGSLVKNELEPNQKKATLSKLSKEFKTIKSSIKETKEDTQQKIDSDRAKANMLSENEIMDYDRLMPGWREKCKYEDGKSLSKEQYVQLNKEIKNARRTKEKEIADIETSIIDAKNRADDGPLKQLHEVNTQISAKEKELESVKKKLKSEPFSEELHKKAVRLESEIVKLKEEANELKKADINKYEALQNGEIKDWNALVEKLDKLLDPNAERFTSKEDTIDISPELQKMLDKAFENLINQNALSWQKLAQEKSTGWKDNHVKKKNEAYDQISQEEAKALREFAKGKLKTAHEKALEIQPSLNALLRSDFDSYMGIGEPPSNVVHLQIGKQGDFTQGAEHGMDVESMLKEIHAIATEGKEFDLNANNCSVTVGRVLESGASTPHLKAQFQNKALGSIGNPQMILNNALRYEKASKSPEDSLGKKISRFNPIEKAGGWCVDKLFVNKKSTPLREKVAAGAAIVPIAIAAGVVTGVKKLSNPAKSLNELTDFIQYANTRPNKKFKAGAIALASAGIAVVAVPAAIEIASNKASAAIARLASKAFKSSEPKKESLQDANVDLKEKDLSKGLEIEDKIKQQLKDKTIEIHAKSLGTALDKMADAQKKNEGPVILDAKTEKMVKRELAKIKDKDLQKAMTQRYNELTAVSLERVQDIQKGVLKDNLPTTQAPQKDEDKKADDIDSSLATDNDEPEIVKLEDAKYAEKEQFYSVMPILGNELAKQIPSYVNYDEKKAKSKTEQKNKDIPPTVDGDILKANEGYLVNKDEREHIIQMFKQNPALQEIPAGSTFPKDHPKAGQALSCSAFKDNHGNVYVMNNAVLGKGSYGTVKVIQAIDTPDGSAVKKQGFYAVKIQDVNKETPIEQMREEMKMNERFGLHFGDMAIKHQVLVTPPKYGYKSQKPDDKAAISDDDKHANPDDAAAKADDDKPADPSDATVQADDDKAKADVDNDEDDNEVYAGSIVLVNDDVADDAMAALLQNHKFDDNNYFAQNIVTLQSLADDQEEASIVEPQEDLTDFNVLHFLELFEKMTAEVEKVHSQGVIHRDIKSENFLYDPDKDEMKLIDFGLAVSMDDPKLTTPYEDCAGSPTNIPPESFHADFKEKLSTKQDIYGLARTFELLMANELLKYHGQAYKDDIPSPNAAPQKSEILSAYLQNFRFENPDDDPHIESINKMLSLLREMKDLHVNQRPEASDVKQRLTAMIQECKQQMQLSQADAKVAQPAAAQPAAAQPAAAQPAAAQPVAAQPAAAQPGPPQVIQVNQASPSTQRHLDYLNSFIKTYDEMGQRMGGKERQQRMREELSAYKQSDNDQIRTLAQEVGAKLDAPRAKADSPGNKGPMLFSKGATSIHMPKASSSDPKSVAEALDLCKKIIQEMSKQQNSVLIKDKAVDDPQRMLKYIEEALSHISADLAGRLEDLNNQTKHIWKDNENPIQHVIEVTKGEKVKDNMSRLEANLDAVKPESGRRFGSKH